jgi:hypothetical protein
VNPFSLLAASRYVHVFTHARKTQGQFRGGPRRKRKVDLERVGLQALQKRCEQPLAHQRDLVAPYYWRKLAAELESASSREAVDTIKIIRDREHESVLFAGVLGGQSHLLIASHRLGPPAAVRL